MNFSRALTSCRSRRCCSSVSRRSALHFNTTTARATARGQLSSERRGEHTAGRHEGRAHGSHNGAMARRPLGCTVVLCTICGCSHALVHLLRAHGWLRQFCGCTPVQAMFPRRKNPGITISIVIPRAVTTRLPPPQITNQYHGRTCSACACTHMRTSIRPQSRVTLTTCRQLRTSVFGLKSMWVLLETVSCDCHGQRSYPSVREKQNLGASVSVSAAVNSDARVTTALSVLGYM